ncbi:hypothetical protein BC628DRAFT_1307530 [Trametes gibbosa]|nr:hypothetical protein BC628DRAFT_1307530 [Trametes gibbosa]
MPRHSLEVLDRLIERALAPREMSIVSPVLPVKPLGDALPEPPQTPLDIPDEDLVEVPPAQQNSLNTVWEEVLSAKEKEMEASPSKVKSLEGVSLPPTLSKKKVAKRKSSVAFKESPDGRNMMVTFDMTGVKKQDMHVSYRTTRLVVSWRVERTAERREGGTVVRDREVRKYSHTIPLAEGTKFEEVRASRDGQKLTLTIPNTKCLRAEVEEETRPVDAEAAVDGLHKDGAASSEEDEEEPTHLRTIPDFETALSAISEYYSCAPTTVI